jgi:hypothetical protein
VKEMSSKDGKTNYDKALIMDFRKAYPETAGMKAAAIIDFALRKLIVEAKK